MKIGDGGVDVGSGGKPLSNEYLRKLTNAMDDLFYEEHKVHPKLVTNIKELLAQKTATGKLVHL